MSLDDGYIMCECCGDRVKVNSNNQNYCEKCFRAIRKEYKKEKQREYRQKCVDN